MIKAYEAILILRVKIKKQLDCKANRKIESGQEIVSEQCSLQECGDFTWRVSDCEELVGGYSQEMMGLVLGVILRIRLPRDLLQ